MTPQQLKNAILQQAIQGKLVEQRAEEGTGQELFEEIQKFEDFLIRNKSIKKELTLKINLNDNRKLIISKRIL